jgi:hypothetical protein
MVNARPFLREEILHVACIFVSTTSSIKRGAKRKKYLYIIGRFHGPFEKSRKKRKKQMSEDNSRRSSNSKSSTSKL